MDKILKFSTEKSLNEKGQYRFVASKEVVDRDGDIVKVDGIDLTNFQKNPVFLFHHDMTAPIGKVTNIEKSMTSDGVPALIADMEFGKSAFSQEVKSMYDDGIMNAVSIGFIPKDYVEVKSDGRRGYDIIKSELYEISAVSVPSNQDALIMRSLAETRIKLKELETNQNTNAITLSKIIELAGRVGSAEKQTDEKRTKLYDSIFKMAKKIKGE